MKALITQRRGLCIYKPLFLLLCLFVILIPGLHAQSVGINTTGAAANPSALLDIDVSALANKKGLLIPRITLVQRNALNPLPAVAQGLMVYQTDGVEGLYYNTSITTTSNWLYIAPASAASSWSLTGNTGTTVGSNFLGTTDAKPLMFKVNNQQAGYIDYILAKANTGFGYQSLNSNTGSYNSAFGYQALLSNIGNYNTATGYMALYSNFLGNFNTANGHDALYNNNGNNNTANGINALFSNTSGSGNTASGYYSLYGNNSGNNNTALGYGADVLSNNLSNATAIGYNAKVNANNNLILGGSGVDAINVGIGVTAATLAKLQVQGSVGNTTAYFSNIANSAGISLVSDWPSISYNCYYNGGTRAMSSSGYPAIIQGDQSSGGLTFSTTNVANTVAGNLVSPVERMKITGAGYVGIGTNNPTKAMLEINGSQSIALAYGYLNSSGIIGTASGTNGYSLYTSDRIAATEFDAFSDARIKKVIGLSSNKQDLSTLRGIRITDYKYIDNISKDSLVHKKVIAQELEKVYPNAVNKITDEVPDIFKLAEIKDGKIIMANNLKAGEKVKLIFKDRTELLEVVEADANSFRIKGADQGKVFVYGRQVSDFRTVDYEALTTLSISAIQELCKDIESLKADNDAMKSDLIKIKAYLGIPATVKN